MIRWKVPQPDGPNRAAIAKLDTRCPHSFPMPNLPPRIDPALCPLCGGDNRCAMDRERSTGVPQGPCWCVTETFDPGLLDRLPDTARGRACICSACLQGFQRDAAAHVPASDR